MKRTMSDYIRSFILNGEEPSIEDIILESGYVMLIDGSEIDHEFDEIGRSHFSNINVFHSDVEEFESLLFENLERFNIYSLIYINDKEQIVIEYQDPEKEY